MAALGRDDERRLTRAQAKRAETAQALVSQRRSGEALTQAFEPALSRAEQAATAAEASVAEAQRAADAAGAALGKARAANSVMEGLNRQLAERQAALASERQVLASREATEQHDLLQSLRARADDVTSLVDTKGAERMREYELKQQLQAEASKRLSALDAAKEAHAAAMATERARIACLDIEAALARRELEEAAASESAFEQEVALLATTDADLKAQMDDAARRFETVQKELSASNASFAGGKQLLAQVVERLEAEQREHKQRKAQAAACSLELRPSKDEVQAAEAELERARAQRNKVAALCDALRARLAEAGEPPPALAAFAGTGGGERTSNPADAASASAADVTADAAADDSLPLSKAEP